MNSVCCLCCSRQDTPNIFQHNVETKCAYKNNVEDPFYKKKKKKLKNSPAAHASYWPSSNFSVLWYPVPFMFSFICDP